MSFVEFQEAGGVAHVRLSRPEANNAFHLAMATDLLVAVTRAVESSTVGAILISAEGRMFSAGGDISAFAAAEPGRLPSLLREMARHAHHAIALLAEAPAPVLCAVQGPAAGLGVGLALVADQVIAGAGASFVAGYTAIGLTPDGGLTYLLPRLVGLRRAQDFLYNNRRLTAREALDWGLVSSVVDDGALMDTAAEDASILAKGPTNAFATIKQQLAANGSRLDALKREADAIAHAASGADGREGIEAFASGRKPVFSQRN